MKFEKDRIDNQNIPNEFVEIVSLLRLHRKNVRKHIFIMLHKIMNLEDEYEKHTFDIIEYALFRDDICIRSFFVEICGEIYGLDAKRTCFLASIIEMLYIHNVMQTSVLHQLIDEQNHEENNDDCGLLKFGKIETELASKQLYMIIMNIITSNKSTTLNSQQKCELTNIISKYTGKNGFLGGHMMEIFLKTSKKYNDEQTRISKLTNQSIFNMAMDAVNIFVKQKQTEDDLLNYSNNLCNLISSLNKKNEKDDVKSSKNSLLMTQSIEAVKKIKNNNKLIQLVKYVHYLCSKQNNHFPIIVHSDLEDIRCSDKV